MFDGESYLGSRLRFFLLHLRGIISDGRPSWVDPSGTDVIMKFYTAVCLSLVGRRSDCLRAPISGPWKWITKCSRKLDEMAFIWIGVFEFRINRFVFYFFKGKKKQKLFNQNNSATKPNNTCRPLPQDLYLFATPCFPSHRLTLTLVSFRFASAFTALKQIRGRGRGLVHCFRARHISDSVPKYSVT